MATWPKLQLKMSRILFWRHSICEVSKQTLADIITQLLSHHNGFTALFPGPPGWASARKELMDFMVQRKINRGRHTDHPAGRHSIRTKQCPPPSSHIFYRPDALPAAQSTVLKHWRHNTTITDINTTNIHTIQWHIWDSIDSPVWKTWIFLEHLCWQYRQLLQLFTCCRHTEHHTITTHNDS